MSILLADTQPDYTFELAPFFFGVSTFGMASVRERIRGRAAMARGIAGVITGAGGAAGVIYLVAGDVDAFGMAAMV